MTSVFSMMLERERAKKRGRALLASAGTFSVLAPAIAGLRPSPPIAFIHTGERFNAWRCAECATKAQRKAAARGGARDIYAPDMWEVRPRGCRKCGRECA